MATIENAGISDQQPDKLHKKNQSSGYTRAAQYAPPERIFSCSITRKYGAIEIEFGVQAPYAAEDQSDQMRFWYLLEKQVNEMHDEWALNELPNVKEIQQQKRQLSGGIYEIDRVEHSVEKGYRVITVAGTPFCRFGAKVNANVLAKANEEFGASGNKFHGFRAEIEVSNNSAHVVAILPMKG